MEEDFVTYDIAVKLKEKGFRERVRGHYKSERHLSVCSEPINCNGSASGDIAAPQIHEVLKWLREKKKIHLVVDIEPNGYFFIVNYNITTDFDDKYQFDIYNSLSCYYDDKQATLAGIKYVIDNLI